MIGKLLTKNHSNPKVEGEWGMNRLFSGFWLKAFLSLTLSMVVIASLVGG
jgi:hypothetical protein